MSGTTSRRNQRGKGSGNRIQQRVGRLTRELNGFTLKGAPDPPAVVSAPWNSFVYVWRSSSDKTFNYEELEAGLCGQLGLRAAKSGSVDFINCSLLLKIHRIKAWETGGDALGLIIPDISYAIVAKSTYAEQVNLFDYPGRNRWAHIGYEFPKAQQSLAVDPSIAKATNIFTVTTPSHVTYNDKTVVYVYGLWKSKFAHEVPGIFLRPLPGEQNYVVV